MRVVAPALRSCIFLLGQTGWVLGCFWLVFGNRSVIVRSFSPFSKGEMLSVFVHFVFFRAWLGVFCRFFSRSSFLRVAV